MLKYHNRLLRYTVVYYQAIIDIFSCAAVHNACDNSINKQVSSLSNSPPVGKSVTIHSGLLVEM